MAADAGRKRLQRFMLGLRVLTTKAHYDLLLAITAAQPTLAASYLANASLSLEPRPSLKWWAGVSCLGNVIQRASQIPLPFLEQAQRWGPFQPASHQSECSYQCEHLVGLSGHSLHGLEARQHICGLLHWMRCSASKLRFNSMESVFPPSETAFFVTRGGRPPSMDSGLVTGLMRRIFPACMPKVSPTPLVLV